MNKIQLQTLSFFFAALLPPKSSDGNYVGEDNYTKNSYYERLGVTKSSTAEDIRKAYKKKSLQYHPDKVSQFYSGDSPKTEEEIQTDFVKVKEAYETLSDPHRRNAYDVLGEEGSKLINRSEGGGLLDTFEHHTLMRNLARASLYSKTKLTLLILLFFLIIVAGPALIYLKVDGKYGMQDVAWILVLIPIWILQALFLLYTVLSRRWVGAMRIICVATSEVFLALKWDGIISWDYTFLFAPFYVHHFIVLTRNILEIRKVKKDLDRTVTVSYLEEKVLPTLRDQWMEVDNSNNDGISQWSSYVNLNDHERDIINKKYIIIDDPYDYGDTFSNESMDPQTKLLYTLTRSPEYELAIKKKIGATQTIAFILSTRMAFFILMVFKLDQAKKWNWFVIFSPIWLEIGLLVCSSCWTCCCYGVIREEVVDNNSEITESDIHDRKRNTELFKDNDPLKADEEKSGTVWNVANMYNADASVASNSVQSQEHDSDRHALPLLASSIEIENEASTDSNLDSHSMEKQAKSLISSGVYCIFTAFLVLLVVKLNGVDGGIDSGNGISAFWVALPLFVVLGMPLFCVLCCICCAGEVESLENIVASKTSSTANEHKVDDAESASSNRTLQGNDVDERYVEDSDGLD